MSGWWPAAVDLSSVSRHAQGSRGIAEYAVYLFVAVGVIALCWLVLFLWDRYRREVHRVANDPRALFYELCRAHHLSRGDRGLLWKAAVHYRLEHPALVFVIPHYVHELAGSSDPQSPAYAGLAVRLFGSVAGGKTGSALENPEAARADRARPVAISESPGHGATGG